MTPESLLEHHRWISIWTGHRIPLSGRDSRENEDIQDSRDLRMKKDKRDSQDRRDIWKKPGKKGHKDTSSVNDTSKRTE